MDIFFYCENCENILKTRIRYQKVDHWGSQSVSIPFESIEKYLMEEDLKYILLAIFKLRLVDDLYK